MVFCNTLDSCRATEHALQEAGLPTRCYHGDVPLQVCRPPAVMCRPDRFENVGSIAWSGPGCDHCVQTGGS